ncbi:SRPBCC domain-containing protein [Pelagibacterium halotolerans]|uniref:SRPBCC domain-containing protein n=1 Tax=Pelagibacterium halotolerans TaxID=531813 RepID=UPI00384B7B72
MTGHRLAVTAPSETEIRVERDFDAPVDLVFDCYTKPEYVARWATGPEGWSFSKCEIDLSVGGKYRYEWTGPDDAFLGLTGEFHEIEKPNQLVSTEVFDDEEAMGAMLVTIQFSALVNKTKMTQTILFESRAARDAAAASGMTEGMGMSLDALDRLLAELQ